MSFGPSANDRSFKMMWGGGNMSAWGWVAMTVGMIGFWVLLIALLVAAVRLIGPRDQADRGVSHLDGRQILDQRFARGEIDEDEYRSKVKALSES